VAIVGWHEGMAGQIHSWLEKATDYHIACFVNPVDEHVDIDPSRIHRDATQFSYPTKDSFKDKPLINSSNWVRLLRDLNIRKILITTDNPYQRFKQINHARENEMDLINAIHPTALIMEDVILYDNIILNARAFIGYRAEIFSGTFINTNSHIDHHNVIKHCVTIDPGVVFAGNVTVEPFARIHTGAVIINRRKVGKQSVIGAGSVITKDVPANVTVVGVPGRIIKYLENRGDSI